MAKAKASDLEQRLAGSVLFKYLRDLPHPHQERRVDIEAAVGWEPGQVLQSILWLRAHGVSVRVVWQPGDESLVRLRAVGSVGHVCLECDEDDVTQWGVVVPFVPRARGRPVGDAVT